MTMTDKDRFESLTAFLVDRGLITAESLDRLNHIATQTQTPISAAMTRLGIVSESDLARAFSEFLQIPLASRGELPDKPPIVADINAQYLRSKRVLPLREHPDCIDLAMADPCDDGTAQGVAFLYGRPVRRFAALETDIEDVLANLEATVSTANTTLPVNSGDNSGSREDIALLTDHASDAPVIRLVNRWISRAVDLSASDIHIEPGQHSVSVRFRVDGKLFESETLSQRWAEPLASRVKLMAKLDIAEKRLPQDGRIQSSVRGHPVDLRVATFPGLHGESVVLRVLGQLSVELDLDKLEISSDGRDRLREALTKPHGIILLTGPTGSGKTTTLYAALNALRSPELKLVTVEDPVEYSMTGISQLQVKSEIGLTYASALRAILRNDPDVIMVGEIRDRETADIAVRAALTGHLVLATLHTNTAAGAVTRLLDLGVEDFLLASTLVFSGAQRLVRKLCQSCAQPQPVSATERSLLTPVIGATDVPKTLMSPVGCKHCLGRGYLGRTPLFEAISMTEPLQSLMRSRFEEKMFVATALQEGSVSLWQHGVQKVLDGVTTLDEVLRVVNAEERCQTST